MESDSTAQVVTVKLRISPELKQKIAESAAKYNRSMNADMVARLERSFEEDSQEVNVSGEQVIKALAKHFNDPNMLDLLNYTSKKAP